MHERLITVTIRIPVSADNRIKDIIERGDFVSRSHFIRKATVKYLDDNYPDRILA